MDTKENKNLRQQVVDFLNSKDRSVDAGIKLLEETGYKPHVTANFKKNISRQDIPTKVLGELRLYLRYYVNPDNSIHDDDNDPFVDPDVAVKTKFDTEVENPQYPDIVKKALYEWRDLYTARSLQHKNLKAVGEKNDVPSINQRKWIGLLMDSTSRRMDDLYKAVTVYKESGTLPSAELFAIPFNPEDQAKVSLEPKAPKSVKGKAKLELPDDLAVLNKMKENLRTKILKAENRLNFQTEKRQEKPNPMPEGPKRIELIKRIDGLKADKLAIETKIANLK